MDRGPPQRPALKQLVHHSEENNFHRITLFDHVKISDSESRGGLIHILTPRRDCSSQMYDVPINTPMVDVVSPNLCKRMQSWLQCFR